MYYEYFGFTQPPFRITPDTSLFFPGGDRGAILDALLYAILNGEGIVKVVGEVGSGKTMLCRMLEKELPANVEVVYLVNPSISPENTLHAIAFELKLGIDSATSRFEVMNALQNYLLERHSQNRQVVVFVEEAQSMPVATLEEIRLLSNLETQQSKLLQIVLFGQPELDEMISRPEIRQLKERITYSFQLAPFKTGDIREYINARVRACGYRGGGLFTDAAIRQIDAYSKGLLRRINILADKSLLAAFAGNSHQVTGKHTRLAVRDSEFVAKSYRPGRTAVLAIGITLLVLLIGGYLLFRPQLLPDLVERWPLPAVPEAAPASGPLDPAPVAPLPPAADDTVTGYLHGARGPLVSPQNASAARMEQDADTGLDQADNTGVNNHDAQVTVAEDAVIRPADAGRPAPAQEILGLNTLYLLQEIRDPRLDVHESAYLLRQLERLPPESVEGLFSSLSGDTCEHCWSIIYRPVAIGGNL